jgi:hypothetical protein
MTFLERYEQETSWQGKAIVMELFHLAMTLRDSNWTMNQTAQSFAVSIGLVSENLKLAGAIHLYPTFINIQTRQEALKRLSR